MLILGSESPPLLYPQPVANNSENMVCGRELSFLLFHSSPRSPCHLACHLSRIGRSLNYFCSYHSSLYCRQLVCLPLRPCGLHRCVGLNMTSHLSFCFPQTSQSAAPHDSRDNTDGLWSTFSLYAVVNLENGDGRNPAGKMSLLKFAIFIIDSSADCSALELIDCFVYETSEPSEICPLQLLRARS